MNDEGKDDSKEQDLKIWLSRVILRTAIET